MWYRRHLQSHKQQISVGMTCVMLWNIVPPTISLAQATVAPVAPVRSDTGITVFLYGRTPPTVFCARLRTCVFEFAPNEVISDKVLVGDTERWLFDVTTAGVNGGTQLLSIKPTDCGLTTNLVVPTNQRVYDLTLRSLPCPTGRQKKHRTPDEDPDVPYTRIFRVVTAEDHAAEAGHAREGPAAPAGTVVTPNTLVPHPVQLLLNFAYHWTAAGTVPWTPQMVFDDGTHTYIKLPLTGGAAVAPVLFALDDDDAISVVNYTAANGFYVTDRLAHRFVLAASADGKRDRVVIENRRWH